MEKSNVNVEFSLASQISSTNFFKSSFARSFVINCRDAKSFDTKLFDLHNNIDDKDMELNDNMPVDYKNNNYFSLLTIDSLQNRCENNIDSMGNNKQSLNDAPQQELDELRKQCQTLREENRLLNNSLRTHQMSNIHAIDNAFLQSQIDTLQWQLKQTEANRQMYRSLMKQVVSFLKRTRKSLDILHSISNNNKNSLPSRNQYNHSEESPRDEKSTTSPSANSSCSGISDFTWSMLNKNDLDYITLFQTYSQNLSQENDNKTKYERIVHKHINDFIQMKVASDHTPPEKLSQEAFRLLRIIESLLVMHEPHLTVASPCISPFSKSQSQSQSSSSIITSSYTSTVSNVSNNDNNTLNSRIERNISVTDDQMINAISIHDNLQNEYCPLTSHTMDIDNFSNFNKLSDGAHTLTDNNNSSIMSGLQSFSASVVEINKIINNEKKNEQDVKKNCTTNAVTAIPKSKYSLITTSTPNQTVKTAESIENKRRNSTENPSNNMSGGVDDESGFSSLSSCQDIAFPLSTSTHLAPIASIKGGCHTEIGLPEIALDRINHRRWSSTPAEIQTLFKKYRNGFITQRTNTESLSVWV